MSIRTKTALSEFRALQAKAAECHSTTTTHRRQHQEGQQRYAALDQQLEQRKQAKPLEFDGALHPLKGTEGERIHQEIQAVGQVDFTDEIAKAEHAERQADARVGSFRFENRERIARDFKDLGDIAAAEVRDAFARDQAAMDQYRQLAAEFSVFVGQLPGAIDGRDVEYDGRIDDIARTLGPILRVGDIGGIYSKSLTPPPDSELSPPYVLGSNGDGYIKVGNQR